MQRIKGACSLYLQNDERVTQYNREQLLGILEDNHYHSPKDSKEGEGEGAARVINVYNPS